jgi:DDE superfamily endonuclease
VKETAAKEASGKPIEIWFQDETRIGQKNKVTRRWAKRGTRPSAPHDQRTSSAYIFGAICPAEGKGAGLVLPSCNSEAMALHLEEISLAVEPGAHAILLLDQAGWHVSKRHCHVWMAPADQGLFCGGAFDRGCGHVFGLSMRVLTPGWPRCCPLIHCPNHISALDGADNATGFGIKPRSSHHLFVTLDSCAALGC